MEICVTMRNSAVIDYFIPSLIAMAEIYFPSITVQKVLCNEVFRVTFAIN